MSIRIYDFSFYCSRGMYFELFVNNNNTMKNIIVHSVAPKKTQQKLKI